MNERMEQELKLLRKDFPDLEFKEDSMWIRIPSYNLPPDIWNRDTATVCFQIPPGYPGNPPYGFFVMGGLRLKEADEKPTNYEEPAQTPFDGSWGKFSWAHNNSWRATSDLSSGSNLLNFVRSFQDRLKEGK